MGAGALPVFRPVEVGVRYGGEHGFVDVLLVQRKFTATVSVIIRAEDPSVLETVKEALVGILGSPAQIQPERTHFKKPDLPRPNWNGPVRLAIAIMVAGGTYWLASRIGLSAVDSGPFAMVLPSPTLMALAAGAVTYFLPKGIRKDQAGSATLYRAFSSTGEQKPAIWFHEFKNRLLLPGETEKDLNLFQWLRDLEDERPAVRQRALSRLRNCKLGQWAGANWPVDRIYQDVTLEGVNRGSFNPELREFIWSVPGEDPAFYLLLKSHGLIDPAMSWNQFGHRMKTPAERAHLVHRILVNLLAYLSNKVLEEAKSPVSWELVPHPELLRVLPESFISRRGSSSRCRWMRFL